MDGRGMSIFGKTWAKNVGAVSEGRLVTQALNQGNMDRIQAFGNGSCSTELSAFPNYRITKQHWRLELQRQLLEAVLAGDTEDPKYKLFQELHLSFWSISRASLRSIKQKAASSQAGGPVLTDSVIVSALLWRHMTRARRLSQQGIDSTCLLNCVNVCRRLDPPFPWDYPGNALAHAKTSATVLDVESHKPIHELAQQISESIEWWTSDRIWGLIAAIDATPHVARVYVSACAYSISN